MGLHYTNTTSYDYSGRRRKAKKAKGDIYTKFSKPFNGIAKMPDYSHRTSDVFYSSAEDQRMVIETGVDQSYKVEASKIFTIAPAYNKGAYQVISKENIKHIGK